MIRPAMLLVLALCALARAEGDFLIYRDAGRLHLICENPLKCSWSACYFNPLPYEGTSSSVIITDKHGSFELYYKFDLARTPWWWYFDLKQKKDGTLTVMIWDSIPEHENRQITGFESLDDALADTTVRAILCPLLRRLGQNPRILDAKEIQQLLYGPQFTLLHRADTPQGRLEHEKDLASLPWIKATPGLLFSIDLRLQ